MAEPSRSPNSKQEPDIKPDIRPDIPELQALDGGGEATPRSRDHLRSVADQEDEAASGAGEAKDRSSARESSSDAPSTSEIGAAERSVPSVQRNEDDADQKQLYSEEEGGGLLSRAKRKGGKIWSSKRNRAIIIGSAFAVSIFGSLVVTLFLGIFDLPNFMKNVEQAGFQRYQLDLQGRSTAWLQAYMELRFGEIDDPNLAPKDRDNIFFRADKVKTNSAVVNWYRALRGSDKTTSAFEDKVFGEQGIKFTSVAYRDGNIIKFRAGVIKFPNGEVRFDPKSLGYNELDALSTGDINNLNGRLSDFFDHQVFESDKEARAAIKAMVKQEYPSMWKGVKRFYLRRDIQNMIGVRKWSFFEDTKTKWHEKKISLRNKIITQAAPDDSKVGTFVKCLFGIPDCSSSADPANPDSQVHAPTGAQKEGDKTNGDPNNPQTLGDGTGDSTLQAGSDSAAAAGDVAGKILSKLIAKAGILSLLDSLSRFDQAVHDHTLSKFMVQAKSAQVEGLFSVYGVAADQLTTGQVNAAEVKAFMDQFAHATHSEGWATVVAPEGGKAAADSNQFTFSKNKQQFCSPQHQAQIQQHPQEAELEYQYLCPQDKVGGPNNAKAFEDAWNSIPAVHPLLASYHAATGGIFDVFNQITSAVTQPAINAALSATGTKDDVQHIAAYAGQQALALGGGSLNINDNTPSGQVSNDVLQGSTVGAEGTIRYQGAAATTSVTAALANKNMLAWQSEQDHSSFANRYLSMSNPKSLLASTMMSLWGVRFSNLGQDVSSIFGNALSSPVDALSQPAHAAVANGYAASKFAGIKTFDMPDQCINASGDQVLFQTPQDATNADELGIFKPSELNWDMMTNSQDWYKALYAKVGGDEDLAMKVWNCAPFDNAIRGGLGAPYGYRGDGALDTSNGGNGDGGNGTSGDNAPGGPTDVSGNAQQVAQDILNNPNITYQFSAHDDVALAAQGKPGTNGVPIAIQALQIPDALGKNHKVVISAYESYGTGHTAGSTHYTGHAVDIASIDGTVAYQNIFQFWNEFSQYASGATFLQKQCGGTAPPQGANITWLSEDSCDHQHITVP